ncbi:hypothetical protein ABBQ38_012895 [Trebouxia sp. C0009 RCD-2024]
MCSLKELLHEAPALLEVLPPAALKHLSSTCRSLRTLFRAQVKVITLPYPPYAAADLHSATWPQLMIVACYRPDVFDGLIVAAHLQILLSQHWEYMMEISMSAGSHTLNAVLLRPCQQEHNPLIDIPSQHRAALSRLADRHRRSADYIRMEGPLMGCKAVQTLTRGWWSKLSSIMVAKSPQLTVESIAHLIELRSVTYVTVSDNCLDASMLLGLAVGWPQLRQISLPNNQLDANAISVLKRADWRLLRALNLSNNPLGIAGIQRLLSWSLPSLEWLLLENAGIDATASCYLAQGQWPGLRHLHLFGNNIGTTGVSYLVQGDWPFLTTLHLSSHGLDEEAHTLLGIAPSRWFAVGKLEDRGGAVSYTCMSNLRQFVQLRVQLT